MKNILILLISLVYFNDLCAQKYQETYIKDANSVGSIWWNQVNSGEFEESYSKLSDILKSRFNKKSWQESISMLMAEFGYLEDRIVTDIYFESKMEGHSDGFYVVVKYNVKYTKTKNHTESLILKQSDKFEWQIFDFNYSFQSLDEEE